MGFVDQPDFPRLGALVPKDGFLPRQLAFRGSCLVYSSGTVTLAAIASIILIIFQASVTCLIPLYAIGVFLSFTLSQAGMALRWRKIGKLKPDEEKVERGSTLRYVKDWCFKMIGNSFGAVYTAVVMMIFAVTKIHDSAYIVLILIPRLVGNFSLGEVETVFRNARVANLDEVRKAYDAGERTLEFRIIAIDGEAEAEKTYLDFVKNEIAEEAGKEE